MELLFPITLKKKKFRIIKDTPTWERLVRDSDVVDVVVVVLELDPQGWIVNVLENVYMEYSYGEIRIG